jgi:hypothetical protein
VRIRIACLTLLAALVLAVPTKAIALVGTVPSMTVSVQRTNFSAEGAFMPDESIVPTVAGTSPIFSALPAYRESKVVPINGGTGTWREYYKIALPAPPSSGSYTAAAYGRSRAVGSWANYGVGVVGVTATKWFSGSVELLNLERWQTLTAFTGARTTKPQGSAAGFTYADAGQRIGYLPTAAPEYRWYMLATQSATAAVTPNHVPRIAGIKPTDFLSVAQWNWLAAHFVPDTAGQWESCTSGTIVSGTLYNSAGTASYRFGVTAANNPPNCYTHPSWEVSNWIAANEPNWASDVLSQDASASYRYRLVVYSNTQLILSQSASKDATGTGSVMPSATVTADYMHDTYPISNGLTYGEIADPPAGSVSIQRITAAGSSTSASAATYARQNFDEIFANLDGVTTPDPSGQGNGGLPSFDTSLTALGAPSFGGIQSAVDGLKGLFWWINPLLGWFGLAAL